MSIKQQKVRNVFKMAVKQAKGKKNFKMAVADYMKKHYKK